MLQAERLEKIKEHLVKNEFADIKKLAELLDVSTATIRRSLKRLEEEKIVEMTHGGAVLSKKGSLSEYPYLIKRQMNSEEKRRIAREAVRQVHKKQSIFLDSSSTVYEMTRFLTALRSVTIATNDILIAGELTNAEDLTVTVLGGSLRMHYYTLTGYFAEQLMKDMCFDHAFIGIDSISLNSGLMITNIEEVQIKRKVVAASKNVVVLCDHSKFEQNSFLTICGFDEVDMIITGRELDEKIFDRYTERGINLVLV
mgnify:CR=1 FL=1